jgi:DNA-binding XRE family transcriptional regulator
MKLGEGGCPGCARPTIRWQLIDRYHYRECGLSNVYLIGGAHRGECSHCRETFYCIEDEFQVLQVIGLEVFRKPGPLTGKEIRYLRGEADTTQDELAEALDVRRATISDWERSDDPPLSNMAKELGCRLVLLSAFLQHLSDHPKWNRLNERHMDELHAFSEVLVKSARGFLRRDFTEGPLEMRMVDSQWSPRAA